jgi:hypothetical protein
MAKKQPLYYEIVLAHAGRRDDTMVETVEATSAKAYKALTDRIFAMNVTLGITPDKAYYGIRQAA